MNGRQVNIANYMIMLVYVGKIYANIVNYSAILISLFFVSVFLWQLEIFQLISFFCFFWTHTLIFIVCYFCLLFPRVVFFVKKVIYFKLDQTRLGKFINKIICYLLKTLLHRIQSFYSVNNFPAGIILCLILLFLTFALIASIIIYLPQKIFFATVNFNVQIWNVSMVLSWTYEFFFLVLAAKICVFFFTQEDHWKKDLNKILKKFITQAKKQQFQSQQVIKNKIIQNKENKENKDDKDEEFFCSRLHYLLVCNLFRCDKKNLGNIVLTFLTRYNYPIKVQLQLQEFKDCVHVSVLVYDSKNQIVNFFWERNIVGAIDFLLKQQQKNAQICVISPLTKYQMKLISSLKNIYDKNDRHLIL